MALTEEQIKKLKQGDPLIIHGTFVKIDGDGDICIKSPMTFCGRLYDNDIKHAHPSAVSIDKSPYEYQYDPCRKFKKGDLVKKRYIYGRSCHAIGSLGIYTVVKDEDTNGGNVIVQDSVNMNYKVKAVFLQLVTAVEDRPVYSVQESEAQDCFDIICDNLCVISFPFGTKERGYYYDKTTAKEAAEAECARLNNLHKQELENNV